MAIHDLQHLVVVAVVAEASDVQTKVLGLVSNFAVLIVVTGGGDSDRMATQMAARRN